MAAALAFRLLLSGTFAQISSEAPITIDNGLVNNEVTAIHQDKYGFLWFGTRGGLNRYDGYGFNLIRYQPGSDNNLSNQAVEVIAEGNNHNLWIGTKNGGLNSYDMLKDSVLHYYPSENIKIQEIKSLVVDSSGTLFIGALHGLYTYKKGQFYIMNDRLTVNALLADADGNIWVGTTAGLYQYNKKRNLAAIKLIQKNPDITSFAFNRSSGTLYMGTWAAGLVSYHVPDGKVKQYLKDTGETGGLASNNTYRIYIDRSKDLWVGTWGGGLFKFHPEDEMFEQINIKPKDVYNTDYDIVLSIEQDITGIMWIGTDGGGICRIDPFKKAFHTITHRVAKDNGLENTHVIAVFEDKNRGIWLGTRGGGLNYSPDGKTFTRIAKGIGGDIIRSFYEDDQKDLWVGTTEGLLIFKDYYHNKNNPVWIKRGYDTNSLSGPKVTALVKDREGAIWVGTQEHGLNKVTGYKDGQPIFKRYPEEIGIKGALQNDRISCMLVDKKDRLWVGTYNGLHLYDRGHDGFILFKRDDKSNNTISNNTILCLAEDNNGNVWIGTQQGINKLSYSDNGMYHFTKYFQSPDFPNDYIHAVLIDKNNNVWMSTNYGIVKLNQITGDFRNFDKRDGVLSNTFSENAAYQSENGKMFFGSISGLTYFSPDSILLNRYKPTVFITNLKINNKPVGVGQTFSSHTILSESIFLTKKIELSYKEDIISLSFSALDFHAPDKNQYQYQLVGFDKTWVNAGNSRTVTYTNLPPASYVFKVRASNSDRIWDNTGRELTIDILPPPWKTWWAYTLYFLVIIGLLWLSRSITLSRIRLKNELRIADLNFQKEHEIAELKSKFFANISHEFRTPLTLMIGPLAGLSQSEKVDQRIRNVLNKVQNQSRRLLSLVNQLLDFNKAENNTLTLNAADQDVVAVLKSIFESFVDEAERKHILYTFDTNHDQIYLHFDKDKMESVAYNLLSYAFNFTPDGGQISLWLTYKRDCKICEIKVTDSGKGISEADKAKVFDRFYQVAQAEPGKYAGTGIGLAFVKDLIELHKGEIHIEDHVPFGTSFIVTLPATGLENKQFIEAPYPVANEPATLPVHTNGNQEELPVVVVAEDNEELNHYITETLKPFAKVISTSNGAEALETSFQYMPDLVVSDIMMPELDGYELCKAIKNDQRTSHIPVILLTAKSDDHSHIQGLELGADSYLSKPFNPAVLVSYVRRLIESRKKLKELFSRRFSIEPGEVEVTPFNEEFIKKAIGYVEENLAKDDFSIDGLANEMNMSRSTFYRKLKAVTGMSGSDFIRLIRLKRSAQLLKTGEYNVSTAAYEAGFNDLKHFRKSFQQQFGVTPSEFIRKETSKS